MNDLVPLAPHQAAALVWPAVDRVFRAVMATARVRGGAELVQGYGGPAATGFLIDFRTRLGAPGGTIDSTGLAALLRYGDLTECQRVLDKQVAHGMLYRRPDGGILATERGRAFLAEVAGLHAEVTGELWAAHPERVRRLVGTLGRLLSAALDELRPAEAPVPGTRLGHLPPAPVDCGPVEGPTDGRAFEAVAPPYEPDGTPPGVLLLNRLGTLRYHRADAHAAAWQAAGHTARSIVALVPGPERLAIELETDRRAAGPYAVLTPPERLCLLADLAALPG
ncbi:hypothetical protein GCM10022225_41720 [Plantactinospora mayteni]|uniref:MarR family transcriptional regulator n=1 Tax=Plantactinospora mayteni TaxID=566021 RepID=A0ABQ4EU62_9ACTN|nr:hypothetical protein [Plantactinospora mayteni]GIG98196.1 hypothetical protein Pma05_47690 [Plantactinospora mayteni]